MSEEKQMPSDCVAIAAINPTTGGRWEIFLRQKKIPDTAKRGMGAAKNWPTTCRSPYNSPPLCFVGCVKRAKANGSVT